MLPHDAIVCLELSVAHANLSLMRQRRCTMRVPARFATGLRHPVMSISMSSGVCLRPLSAFLSIDEQLWIQMRVRLTLFLSSSDMALLVSVFHCQMSTFFRRDVPRATASPASASRLPAMHFEICAAAAVRTADRQTDRQTRGTT